MIYNIACLVSVIEHFLKSHVKRLDNPVADIQLSPFNFTSVLKKVLMFLRYFEGATPKRKAQEQSDNNQTSKK